MQSNNASAEKLGFKKKYRNIFILDSIVWFNNIRNSYSPTEDLVLTYDLNLKKKIIDMKGDAFYIDHIIDRNIMNKNNYIIYDFLKKWYLDKDGKDIFIYKNTPFGFSFRMEFWNDFTFYARIRLCLSLLNNIKFNKIFIGSENNLISSVLDIYKINYSLIEKNIHENMTSYYFPIAKWMNEQIRPSGLRGVLYKIREVATAVYGYTMPLFDKIFSRSNKSTIFIQEYFPTRKIIAKLREDKNIKILLANFSRNSKLSDHLNERLIPISGSSKKFNTTKNELLNDFKNKRQSKLILTNGEDISPDIYLIIEQCLQNSMSKYLRTLNSIINYTNNNKIDLEILIANIGHEATLLDCVCRKKKIPSYLIINGLLLSPFDDESKVATMINSYSTSIKENYFFNMNNIVTLGDPRMDAYTNNLTINTINRKTPRVTIGAAAFSNVDLNSYVAVEFEFMHDILCSFQEIIEKGIKIDLVIKTRSNGYKEQYKNFINNYFPKMSIKIISTTPMQELLEKTDFYITTYSQTLFEASCLGIPVVYYKKDKEILNPPFDNKSELVTVSTSKELVQAFYDFQNNNKRYEAFLEHKIMEKYIGPLDGKNLERNLDFIHQLLDNIEKENTND